MKATATINQVELEQKAIDSMISYEKGFITYSEMEKAVSIMAVGKDTGELF